MDAQAAGQAQNQVNPNPEKPLISPIEKLKKLSMRKKLLIGAAVIILISLVAFFFLSKPPVSKTDQPQIPSNIIAKVGDSNVYQGYLDKELKLYPATKSAEVKEQLKQKVVDDQITLVEAKKEGMIQTFNESPVLTDQEYLERTKNVRDLKKKIEDERDSLSGALISVGFFQGKSDPQTLAKNQELALSKINPIYEKVKNKQLSVENARLALFNDPDLKRLDLAIATNVSATFQVKQGNVITYWSDLDKMLWDTAEGEASPLYIGKAQDNNGNIVQAMYVFGFIDKKTQNKGYANYKEWLEQKRKLYNSISYNKDKSSLFFSLPAFTVYAQFDGDNGNNNDNGGNGNDGNLSNQNDTNDNPPNSCDNIPNSGADGCGGGGGSGPLPPPPPLSPAWAGTVFTETGAKLPGANVSISCSTGSGGAVSNERGAYSSPPISGVNVNCTPAKVSATYGGQPCESKQVPIPNSSAVIYTDLICNLGVPACNKPCPGNGYCEGAEDGCNTCRPNASGVNVCQPPPACGTGCQKDSECAGNKDGCTVCLPGDSGTGNVCRPPAACNVSCTKDSQCAGGRDGCTVCLPNDSGTGNVCRPPAACNVSCTKDSQCAGGRDGCTVCLPNDSGTGNVCRPPAACNVSCTKDSQCAGGRDGCNSCRPADTGTANVCRPTPACGVSCTKDSQCAGARNGCTACVSGVCKVPPACGVACTTKADCTSARDGCTECLEGTCTNFNDQMCKCDGMIADIAYPSTSFNFEAFGKVEGSDVKKAEIADITFRMTKDNQVVAKSNPINPSIVENTASKVRFKAAWSTPPPPIDKNSVYRVFADVRCKPKKIIASNNQISTESKSVAEQKLYPPKGLEWIVKNIAKLFGGKVNPFVSDVLAQLSSPSPSPSRAQTNLQLQTLNFVKLMDTDNCRFVMFKFDETLF